jgi:PAS domain S-box-containing protein
MNDQRKTKKALIQELNALEYAEGIINAVREPLIVLDKDLRVVTASRSFYEFFKVNPNQTKGQLIYDLGNRQWNIPKLRKLLEDILPQKTTFDDYEVEHDFTTIGKRVMLLNARQIQRALGKERIILLAIEDITQRKQLVESQKETALDALRKSEDNFRRSLDESPLGVRIVTAEGETLYANRAIADIYGYDNIEELGGAPLTKLYTPESYAEFKIRKEKRERGEFCPSEYEISIVRKNGKVRQVQVFSKEIFWNGARQFQVIYQDITDRIQVEEGLRESRSQLNLALQGAEMGVWQLDIISNIRHFDEQVCRLLGIDPSSFRGMPEEFYGAVHPDDVDYLKACLTKAIEQNELYNPEYRVIWPDGNEHYVVARGRLFLDASGKPLRLDGVLWDITERKKAERERRLLNEELEQRVLQRTAQLNEVNKELEKFSYSVSHDLRAPLRSIDGWSLALLEDYGDRLDDQARTYLERVRTETQMMGMLINDLLNLSRITRIEPQLMLLDLTAMAHSLATHLQEEKPDRRIEFIIQPDLRADGDNNLINIALTNLFDNAIKFTGKRSLARIEFGDAEVDGGKAFFVRDNGAGFDMTYADKLFGTFQRLHKASEFPGTGIGLATVQRIIHRHGGRIWANAQADQGATFYFTLKEII